MDDVFYDELEGSCCYFEEVIGCLVFDMVILFNFYDDWVLVVCCCVGYWMVFIVDLG